MSRNPFLCLMVVLLTATTANANKVFKDGKKGAPNLKSINVLTFASDGVLLIGDGRGGQIIAVETGDTVAQPRLSVRLDDVDQRIAASLGTKSNDIVIIDLAVNPVSGKVYVAVRRQSDRSYAIVTVSGNGTLEELELDSVSHASLSLTGGKVKVSNITDVAWADGKIVASGKGSDTFASKIFSVATPFTHGQSGDVASAETYHVAHGKWETKAPMSVLIPFKEGGKSYVVGAFSCTPIVKYPVDSITTGSKIKGTSVLELGSGNRPLDMFIYTKDGKPYVLANTYRFHHNRRPVGPSPYWTVRFEQGILAEQERVNKQALRRVGGDVKKPLSPKVVVIEAFHGVTQMDQLDEKRAVVLRQIVTETEKDGKKVKMTRLSLEPIALP